MGKKFVGLNGLKYFWNKIKVKIEEAQKTVSDKIAEVENSLTAETTARENADKTLQANIENKVDKVNGKGLSTNDYTTEEKNKLSGLDNYDDTAVKSSITDLQTQITSNKTAIESEEKRATTAENNLSTSISSVSTNLSSHTGNKSNPHGVTKSQVGLGNVPNVATNDQTPTYTVASENTALTSGEKLSVAFGKIAKAISSLISHLANKSNPHGVTKAQVGLGNVVNTGDSATPTSGGITKFTTGGAYTLKQAIDENTTAIATLNGTGTGSVTKTVSDKIAEVVAGAPESLDTLKEISDWIDTHEDSASAMNTAIQANATAISDEAKARAAADTALQTAINGKAASSHTHDDRYYTESEMNTKLSGKANSSHTHTKSQITDFPTSLKNPNALTINGKTYDGSSAVNAGVQTVANGGTGKTTGKDAANYFLNELTTGSSAPVDDDYFICQYAGGGITTTTYQRRPVSKLWNYIKGKISSVLGLTATNYGGKASTAGTADKTVNDISITFPYVTESGQYVIPLGNIPDPTSTEIKSPYNWDITGFFSIIRASGHNGSHVKFEAGHGYSHAWITYAYLDKEDFNHVTTSMKAFQYNGEWWLGLYISTNNQNYVGKMTITYSRGLPATPTCILYNSKSDGVANEEIYNSIQDIPSSWWGPRTIHNPTTFTQNITAPNITSLEESVAGKSDIGHTHNYLPLSGGAMTGDIKYKGSKSTYNMIKFIDNKNDTYGNGISIGGGGLTIIGGGESSDTVAAQETSGGNEKMIIANDTAIDFYTNAQSGFSSAKHITMNTDGTITANGFNGKASTAGTADKATQDGNGNNIVNTYATKTELENVIAGDISSKMNTANPEGTGSFSLNRYTDKENGIGKHSVSMGDDCGAMGEASVALGYSTFAHNIGSVAEGFVTHSRGIGSHAEGRNTNASGDTAHAEGESTTASGATSHAEGASTEATGNYTHAEGYSTHATGMYAHAEGNNCTASKDAAHVEGYNCTANGIASHAEGYNCTASKDVAHAEGMYTTADGQTSHTSGYYTQTTNFAEFACGQFNKSTKSDDISARTIFSVGNGNSVTDRFNALEVKDNGDVYAKKLYVGRYGSEVHEVLHSGNMTFDEKTATLTITV